MPKGERDPQHMEENKDTCNPKKNPNRDLSVFFSLLLWVQAIFFEFKSGN